LPAEFTSTISATVSINSSTASATATSSKQSNIPGILTLFFPTTARSGFTGRVTSATVLPTHTSGDGTVFGESSDSSPVKGRSVGISVSVITGGVACAAILLFVTRWYKNRRQ